MALGSWYISIHLSYTSTTAEEIRMGSSARILIIFLLILSSTQNLTDSRTIDFFYLVLQWPGSYCSAKHGCCYPNTGRPPKDFTIAGLRPFYIDGTSPTNCNPNAHLNISQISDLRGSLEKNWPYLACPSKVNSRQLWDYNWKKYGSCSESSLTQHQYYEGALKLKQKVNLLKILTDAGIHPNGTFYSKNIIDAALVGAFTDLPGLVCNQDKSGNSQIYQVYLCADTELVRFIDCPGIPMGTCVSNIKFPPF